MVADLEKIFIGAIESTYTQDVEGLESLLEDFGSRFHPRHYLMLIVKWLLVRTGYCEMHEYVSKFLIIVHLQINLYGRKKGYLNTELSERRLESKERFCVEYMEALERIEMARQLKEINESAEEGAGDTLRPGDQVQSSFVGIHQIRFQDTPLVTAIKQRYKENKEGSMNSIFFIYIKGENQEVSGHIDMANR